MTPAPFPISGGCVVLARKMLDSDLMDQSALVVKLWVWLLLKANWRDRQQLDRGQLVTTIAEMQEAMSYFAGWRKITPTKDEIRTAYEALSKATRITTRKTTRGMVVTVLNYDVYQDVLNYAAHTADRNETATKPPSTPHDTESLNHITSSVSNRKPGSSTIAFNRELGKFHGITESMVKKWQSSFPLINVRAEIAKAEVWAAANPGKAKKNWHRFIVGWLGNAKQPQTAKVIPIFQSEDLNLIGEEIPA